MNILISFINWLSKFAFITALVIYIANPGTLPKPNMRDLEIVMLVSILVFIGTKYMKSKLLPNEIDEDDPLCNTIPQDKADKKPEE